MTEPKPSFATRLASQGFGILTEIDVAATFKAKLGVERPPLKILGACNPRLAYQAIELDPSVALMLPCNVVLAVDGERTHVSIADPRTLMPGDALASLADDAARRLSAAARRDRSGELRREHALVVGYRVTGGRTARTSASMAVASPESLTTVRCDSLRSLDPKPGQVLDDVLRLEQDRRVLWPTGSLEKVGRVMADHE